MTIESKFNLNDTVYFLYEGKCYKGTILEIINWDSEHGFLYKVHHSSDKYPFDELMYESCCYTTIQEVLETIFVED